MHKRIKELLKKSHGTVTDDDGDVMELPVIDHTKFAELIVRECLTVVDSTPLGYGDYRDQILRSMRDFCVVRLKEHFGVE